MDDFPNDATTTGRLVVGTPIHAVFDNGIDGSTANYDSDWFRVALEADKTYEFAGEGVLDIAELKLIDPAEGVVQSSRDLQNLNEHRDSLIFTPSDTRDYLIAISNYLGMVTTYTLETMNYEIPESVFTRIGLQDRTPFTGQIETEFDRDYFRVTAVAGWTYQFDLRGVDSASGTLSDPNLRIYDGNRNLLATQNDGGILRDASVQFVAPYTGDLYLSASGLGTNTGSYNVESAIVDYLDDAATGSTTRSRIPLRTGQNPVVVRRLEVPGDIDWHKVDLVAGQWYQFGYVASSSNSLMFLRDPDNEIIKSSVRTGHRQYTYIKAEQTGTHHLIFRNGSGDYTLYAVANTAPPITSRIIGHELVGDETISAQALVSLNEFPAERVEIFSEASFHIDEVEYQRFVVHSFTPDQLPNIVFQGDVSRDYDVSFRAVENQIASGWVQSTISSRASSASILATDRAWTPENTQRAEEKTVSFRFADSKPSYFADGRFTGFQPVSSAVEDLIESILYPGNGINLPQYVDLNFVYDETEQADIQIFTADSDELAIGYAPGKFGFGDIVLDNEVYSGNASPQLGTEAHFKLVRAIATALGVKHFAPELNFEQSVVGISGTQDAGNPLPTSFGTWDINYLQSVYGKPTDQVIRRAEPILGVLSNGEFTTTILQANDGTIKARDADVGVIVDLREGGVNRLKTGDIRQSYTVGIGVRIPFAEGSRFDDDITGNHIVNHVNGFAGNDRIRGLGGDDQLRGGEGNDTYIYETGDGNDTIRDFSIVDGDIDAGVDTLQITGKYGMNRIEEDLTFRIRGNDLIVDLDMNGEFNRYIGAITIKNMASPSQRVERLDLRNFSNQLGVYSLVSVWESATNEKLRFAATGGSDSFGLVVSPVG